MPDRLGEPDENFKIRVELILLRNDWTRAELARRLGRDRSLITHWLSGRNLPGRDTVRVLAQVSGESIDWLMGENLSPEERKLETAVLKLIRECGDRFLELVQDLPSDEILRRLSRPSD